MLDRLRAVSIIGLLAILMAFQGGFFPEAVFLILVGYGVVACALGIAALGMRVRARTPGREPRRQEVRGRSAIERWAAPACAALIAVLLILSSLVHGTAPESLLWCLPWLLAAIGAVVCGCMSEQGRAWMLKGIAWMGVVSSFAGIALFADVPHIGGTVNAGRLQFLFQYANAAGAWFACTALLSLSSDDERLQRCVTAPLTALLLTQSVGAIGLCALVAIGRLAVLAARMRDSRTFLEADVLLMQAVLAGVSFVVLKADVGAGVLVALGAFVAFYELWPKAERLLKRSSRTTEAFLVLVFLCAVVGIVLAVSMGARLAQAMGTWAERIVQAKDAASVLAQDPLAGIGPDQWRSVYPAVQTMEYRSAVVHCGYLQLGLDAGVPAPLVLLALIVITLRRSGLVRSAIVFLGLHSFVDFDLQFAFFVVLVCVLCASKLAPTDQPAP